MLHFYSVTHNFFRTNTIFFIFLIFIILSCNKSGQTYDGVNGIKISQYPDGKLKAKMSYKDGSLNGKCYEYYPNGQIEAEYTYKENQKNGILKAYYDNGKINHIIYYKKNVKDSLFTYYSESGKIKKEGFYKDGNYEGAFRLYHENGKIASELSYKEGLKHGKQKYFYESGQLKAVTDFHEGQPGLGLEEYTAEGKRINHNMHIVVREINKLAMEEKFIYMFQLSKPGKEDKFYLAELTNGKYFPKSYVALDKKNGYFIKDFFVPRYAYLMEKIDIIAKTKTSFGNDLILMKRVNVALNNYN